jgi:hypothetical protein
MEQEYSYTDTVYKFESVPQLPDVTYFVGAWWFSVMIVKNWFKMKYIVFVLIVDVIDVIRFEKYFWFKAWTVSIWNNCTQGLYVPKGSRCKALPPFKASVYKRQFD